jgi:type IV secretory pathway VirB4 component
VGHEHPDNKITVFAESNFRNQWRRFGIKPADRWTHIYIIGKMGTGKSTLIASLLRQDATNGGGLALLDPRTIWPSKC